MKSYISKKDYYNREYSYDIEKSYISKSYLDPYELESKVTSLKKENIRLNDRIQSSESVLHKLTEGNEAMQRTLIQIDPKNIQYIENPYVSIQIEAITADPSCIDLISYPAQETIDTWRIIK